MLLAVDIGNSRIKFGVFDGEKLVAKVAVPTTHDLTSSAIARVLESKLPANINAGIVCSVVPEVNNSVLGFVTDRSDAEPMLVTSNLDFGIGVNYQSLEDLGTDRLVNAFSAVEKHGFPSIVCSFGTALTIDVVNNKREFAGGVIAPGMKSLAAALDATTSRLPEVEILKPEKIVQNTTAGSLQSGIVNGYLFLVDGLLNGIKAEVGGAKVIATGGFATMVAENNAAIDIVDNDLTLDGLRRLHERLTA